MPFNDETAVTYHIADSSPPSITKFYAGEIIFITGISGFLGKALLEKILRVAPDVRKIYVLLRPKKGCQPQERLKNILQSQIFDKVKITNPNFASKIILLSGDITEEKFGLSESNLSDMLAETTLVFHVAATVKFEEPLRNSIELNVLSVRTLIQLCRRMKHLKAAVHVSTAYSNSDRYHIDEIVYPDPVPAQKLLDANSWMDDDLMDHMTPKLLGKMPNTYTFTKKLAENIIVTEGADLPIAIIRPSIIGGSLTEPVPGWVDNFYGGTGLMIMIGKGMLRKLTGANNKRADVIPVDIAVNMLMAICWHTYVSPSPKQEKPIVYNCCSSPENPIVWRRWLELTIRGTTEYPYDRIFRRPNCSFLDRDNLFRSYFHLMFSHWIPAYIVDAWLYMCGKKPRMRRNYHRVHKATNAVKFFTSAEFEWSNNNSQKLWQVMTPEDRKVFSFKCKTINWEAYISNYCMGIKTYLLKEDLANLSQARMKLARHRRVRWGTYFLLFVMAWYVTVLRSKQIKSFWFALIGLCLKMISILQRKST